MPRGRPNISDDSRLTKTITIRLTSEELKAIHERAEVKQRKPGDLVRVAAIRPWLQGLAKESDNA